MKLLEGKKTYLGILLAFASLLASWLLPGEVSKDDLTLVIDQGEEIYVTAKRDLWPMVSGFLAALWSIYGRAVAKTAE